MIPITVLTCAVDICITMRGLETVCALADVLAKSKCKCERNCLPPFRVDFLVQEGCAMSLVFMQSLFQS